MGGSSAGSMNVLCGVLSAHSLRPSPFFVPSFPPFLQQQQRFLYRSTRKYKYSKYRILYYIFLILHTFIFEGTFSSLPLILCCGCGTDPTYPELILL